MKQKLKKLILVAGISMMAFGITGCGEKDTSVSDIYARGVLRVAAPSSDTDYFYYDSEAEDFRGTEAEMIDIVSQAIGLPVEYNRMSKEEYGTGLSTGVVDLAIGSIGADDNEFFDYGKSMSYADKALFIVSPCGLYVGDISVFQNQSVGVDADINSSSYSQLLYVDGINPLSFETKENAAVALLSGDISGYVCFKEDAEYLVDTYEELQMQNGFDFSNEEYVIITMPSSFQLLSGVNSCVQNYMEGEAKTSWVKAAEEAEAAAAEKISNQ